jgi:CHRD domain
MARRTGVFVVFMILGAVVVGALASFAIADSGGKNFRAQPMLGAFEPPVISSPGARGSFRASLQGSTVNYTLSYTLGAGNTVTQAHIHLGQFSVNGGISVWLCGTASNPGPAGTPVCPASGTVEDSFTAADVVGPAGQGITAGQFDELLAAMRADLTYANVHSTTFPGGEIRAQIRGGGGDDDDD